MICRNPLARLNDLSLVRTRPLVGGKWRSSGAGRGLQPGNRHADISTTTSICLRIQGDARHDATAAGHRVGWHTPSVNTDGAVFLRF